MEEPSRKRARASSPHPTISAAARHESSELDRMLAASLRAPSRRNAALNDLLRRTSSHDKPYALSSDLVLRELAGIVMKDCWHWNEPAVPRQDRPHFRSATAWTNPVTKRGRAWRAHCTAVLGPQRSQISEEDWQTMQVVLVILRNLSFVGANLRLLAYSPAILDLLVGCLYDGTDNYYGSEEGYSSTMNSSIALSAMQTLVHLAQHLEVSGQRLLADKLFYQPDTVEGPTVPEEEEFGQAVDGRWGMTGLWLAKRLDSKEDTISNVSKQFVLALTKGYLPAVWSVFPALGHVLTDTKTPRAVILMALDLLQELINQARIGVVGDVDTQDKEDEIPTIRTILVQMPDVLLERLADMLYVPRLGPDALEYVDPVHNIVTRVTTLKLLTGYDATVDTDVRDRALEVLVPLLELDSPRLAERLGTDPQGEIRCRLWDAVLPILTTGVGRNEAALLATQLLRELSSARANRLGFLYVQERLLELASRDARVSNLVWNHLYVKQDEEEEEEDSGDAEGEGESGE